MTKLRASRRWILAAAAAGGIALLPALVSGQAAQYRTTLAGSAEVPPVTTIATGTFTGTLDQAAGTFAWTLSVPAITAVTAAHIHQGAAGTNGPIVLNLFAAPQGSPASSINVSGTARVADLTGPLATNFTGFVQGLNAGTLYVNVHTSANAGGEIRGQVSSAQAVPAATGTVRPAAPGTGQAGLVDDDAAAGAAVLLLALAVAVVVGGRALLMRNR